jgi:hypothetical protein
MTVRSFRGVFFLTSVKVIISLMSDDYVYVIPEEPGLVPDKATYSGAVGYFRRIAPQAGEITASVSDQLEFIHCGGNFGEIRCPGCGEAVELESWQHWMDEDFQGKREGFALSRRLLPCCGARSSLHELSYEWPMGFACFKISAQNPNIGKLSKTQSRRFQQLLGLAVRIIYEHR